MTDFEAIASQYIVAWNTTDDDARRAAVRELWAEDATYVDPIVAARGHAQVDATIAAVQAQFPTFRFRLVGTVDGHHNQCRFRWELGPEGADAPIAGSDVAVVDDDGRVASVLGFLDRVPTA